ncbi:cobalamin-binding protein [Ammoniphilus oxalaticus]|uniref:Cobalamin-binding protein n=1 Tax=Ammoniphilus oxalaticus TaxID=66863 RepID=A0A419SDE8_9BACL|nr:ABC transporter substrate-binding protein [Ammoniphilus oxalaticus]RKD21106.1 cobalamin-binding protein [Ammoniphilus oxalaticus]
MKKFLASLLITAITLTVSACGQGEQAPRDNVSQNESQQEENGSGVEKAGQATVYPITVKDATGTEHTFEKAPERIVSTSPSETEVMFALGLGDKLVGVSDFDNYPEEALEKPKVGGVSKPNEEAIISANPDLVIGGISMKDDVAKGLRDLDIPLYKTEPKKVSDVLDNIIRFGVITDTQEKAEELVAQMSQDIQFVTDKAEELQDADKKKVYIEFSPGWTVGRGEFMDELITIAGGLNIARNLEGWNAINEEKIIQDNPDVILFTSGRFDDQSGATIDELIRSRGGWEKISALQEDRLIAVDGDVVSRPGPRITEALKIIAEAIYPELYKQ